MRASLKARLTALTVALALGLLVIAGLLVATVYEVERRGTEKQLLATARALSLAVDGQMLAEKAELEALATSDSLKTHNLAAFDRRARKLSSGSQGWFVLYDLTGLQLVNTDLPLGASPPSRRWPDFKTRLAAAAAKGTSFSGLRFGHRANQPLVALDRIVRTDGGRTFLLTLAVSPRVLEHVFAEQKLPTGWTGSLVDQSTRIIARNEDSDHYLGRSVTAPAARAMAHSQEGVVDSVSQLGQPTLLAFTRSNLTGWWLLVGLPEGEAALPIDRAVTLLAPLIFALLGGGALLVALTMRRVGASLRTVAELAARVGRGEAVETMTTGISETDVIAQVLHSASVKLRERDAELRRAAHLLEQRVEARTAELETAHNQLAQSQKLEAVGQLTGGVAHDFNNLLTIIRSSIDFLQRPDLSDERRQRYIRAIADTVERASRLTGQLLAFARRQPLRPEVFDVDERVRNTVALVTPLVGALVRITIHPCPDSCYAYADPGQLETALVNLIINARDAMKGEGEISIAVSWTEHVPAVRGQPARRGGFIAIRVVDTGEGIAPDRIDAIFEPFYTTKAVGKGTGLGLSQVFGFAKQSDGEVEVQSAPGAGAAFTLYLPRSADATMASPPNSAAPAHPVGRGGCILVVEDNEAVGQFSTEMIQDLGYSTVWVTNAADALAMLEASERKFDLVFSDVIMPGMNGVDLAREIKRRNATLPVILTSGYSDVLVSEEGRGFELVQKPYSAETLAIALHRAMAG